MTIILEKSAVRPGFIVDGDPLVAGVRVNDFYYGDLYPTARAARNEAADPSFKNTLPGDFNGGARRHLVAQGRTAKLSTMPDPVSYAGAHHVSVEKAKIILEPDVCTKIETLKSVFSAAGIAAEYSQSQDFVSFEKRDDFDKAMKILGWDDSVRARIFAELDCPQCP